jgi:hypothetical protein
LVHFGHDLSADINTADDLPNFSLNNFANDRLKTLVSVLTAFLTASITSNDAINSKVIISPEFIHACIGTTP